MTNLKTEVTRADVLSEMTEPSAALDVAGQAVRTFNHQTSTRFDDHRNGWNHVPDVYRCLGELTYLSSGLRQAIWHMSEAMQAQLDAGHVGADPGSRYEGHPDHAIAAARAALSHARSAAAAFYAELDSAQTAISRIHYAGPDLDNKHAQ